MEKRGEGKPSKRRRCSALQFQFVNICLFVFFPQTKDLFHSITTEQVLQDWVWHTGEAMT